jgi:hypothetical protein
MTARKRTLHLARPEDAPAKPSIALVKQALKLWGGRGISKAVRHTNARKWISARMAQGDRHILNAKFEPRWGEPGLPMKATQVFAPRRLGAK